MAIDFAFERSYPTPLQNSTLLPLLVLSLARQKNSPDTTSFFKDEYDYIIVGAGSAGSVVASRLSEIFCVSVLLVEAGHAPPIINDVPAFGTSFSNTDLDWQYMTVPQKHAGDESMNRQMQWSSGKGLGGTSLINDGVYVRGNRRNYNEWSEMGAKGWGYEEVLPYFKKMEDNKDLEYIMNGYHGVGGPVTVMKPRYNAEIKGAVYHAATEMGYEYLDSNDGRQTGFYDLQANLRDCQRCQTAKAYLVPAENRKNLHILPNAFVRKIVMNNRKAVGVTFDYYNQTYTIKSRKEVIISAGVVNTPKLLMLSGIGPREELTKHNIPVIADLPVGQNFHDHGGFIIDFFLRPFITDLGEKITSPESVTEYIASRTGPLCTVEGTAVTAFFLNDEVRPTTDFPNYQLNFIESTTVKSNVCSSFRCLNFTQMYQKLAGSYERQPLMLVFVSQVQPRSRGSVKLRSNCPYDEPLIDPNYLADPLDLEDLVQGVKTAKKILASSHMKRIGWLPDTHVPDCKKYAENEDLYIRCQIRSQLYPNKHAVGTAKMGDPNDSTTVVDPHLRVKGIESLRVVDNSIMPKVTSGNTNVPAIMIGEKGSDLIKESVQCGL